MRGLYNLFRLTFISSCRWFLLVLVSHTLLAGVFHIKYFEWHVYMMYGYILIAFLTSFYFNKEFKEGTKYFVYSLPLSKETIVYFRYLISFLIFASVIGLWFLNCYLFNMLWEDQLTWFDQIFYVKVLFMATFFYTIQQSFFLPVTFVWRTIGITIWFILSLTSAIVWIPILFYPYSQRYESYFSTSDMGMILMLAIVMVGLMTVSIFVSRRLSLKRDI
jgi:ABC-type transport system involved in multi-copper enzyme maturation permease subunit